MVQFAQPFPEEAIVVTLSQQLSWSHFHALLPIKGPLTRGFNAEMWRIERWDVRTLRQKIGGVRSSAPRCRTATRVVPTVPRRADGALPPLARQARTADRGYLTLSA
jgi:hypothetical protein